MSFEESSILYPEGVSQTIDECWTGQMDSSWKNSVSKNVKWQYLGLANGHSRTFPGSFNLIFNNFFNCFMNFSLLFYFVFCFLFYF